MRTVVQRVRRASVTVEGAVRGEIGPGLVALLACEEADTTAAAHWTVDKLVNLRIFEDAAGKMNLSVLDTKGGLLLVPNFTVAGDASKGRRPSFDGAMKPESASALFDHAVGLARAAGVPVATGVFRATMLVNIENDGPVTLVLQSPPATQPPAR